MKLSFFIFRKFIRSNRHSQFLNLISTISIIGISLGVATLIIALSIVSGLEKVLTQKLMEIDSHIKVFSIDHRYNIEREKINEVVLRYKDELIYVSPFLENTVLIYKQNRSDGLIIKGVEDPNYIAEIKSNIIEGSFNLGKQNQLIIGNSFAKRFFLNVGDKVTLISLGQNSNSLYEQYPNIDLFIISGIYQTGITKYDDVIAFTDLKSAQKFLIYDNDLINGIDIKLKNLSNLSSIVSQIRDNIQYPLYAQSIFEIHRGIFTWVELQKKPIPIVLSFIIIVAVFNIISTLFLIVIERTSVIGILKSLGLKKSQIFNIFLLQGIQISFYGILLGNIIAISLIGIQYYFNIIKVPSNIYMVTNIPFDFSVTINLYVSLTTILLSSLVSLIPSIVSAKINPIEAIKFQ